MRTVLIVLLALSVCFSLAPGVQAANPQLTIAAEPWPLVVNQLARITIVGSNPGPDNANNVIITDGVPNNMGIVGVYASQGDVSVYNQAVTVRVGTLAPGQSVTIYLDVVVVAAYPSDAPFNNCAGMTFAGGTARLSCLPNQSASARPSAPIRTLPPNGQRPISDPNRPPVFLPVSGAPAGPSGLIMLVGSALIIAGLISRRRSI